MQNYQNYSPLDRAIPIFNEFCEIMREEFQRKNLSLFYNDNKLISTYFSEKVKIPKTNNGEPLIEAGYETYFSTEVLFYVDFTNYGISDYDSMLKNINEKIAYRINPNIDFINKQTIRVIQLKFLDGVDTALLYQMSDEDERRRTILGKWNYFNSYINAISQSINSELP